MPGGYDGYLVSLREVVEYVSAARPAPSQLQSWMREQYRITSKSAYDRWRTLCRAGLLAEVDLQCVLSDACEAWRSGGDLVKLIAHLHDNVRFVGELLAQLDEPKLTQQLLHTASERFLMGWQATTQIDNRRGWLQSAGMVEHSKVTGRLARTERGTVLLDRLRVEPALA